MEGDETVTLWGPREPVHRDDRDVSANGSPARHSDRSKL